jgi:hypothetical protein
MMTTKKKSGLLPNIFNTLLMQKTEYDDLCRMAEKGDLSGFQGLLESHKKTLSVNGKPPHKIPLHFAAAGNQPRVIQYILQKKHSRIGLRNEKGITD